MTENQKPADYGPLSECQGWTCQIAELWKRVKIHLVTGAEPTSGSRATWEGGDVAGWVEVCAHINVVIGSLIMPIHILRLLRDKYHTRKTINIIYTIIQPCTALITYVFNREVNQQRNSSEGTLDSDWLSLDRVNPVIPLSVRHRRNIGNLCHPHMIFTVRSGSFWYQIPMWRLIQSTIKPL